MNANTHLYAINGYSYNQSHSLVNFLSKYSEKGYRSFEAILYPGHIWPSEMDGKARRDLRAFIENNGLRLLTLGTPALDPNLVGVAPETRMFSRGIIRAAIELARDIGVPGIIASPGKAHPLQPEPKSRLLCWLYEALDELVPLAESAGTQVLIENLPNAFLPDADSLMEALDGYGDDRVGVVYDTANAAFFGEDVVSGIRRVGKRLRRLHLSDTTRETFRHDAIGQGDIDFAALGHAMREVGYALPPILELIVSKPDIEIERSVAALSDLGWGELVQS